MNRSMRILLILLLVVGVALINQALALADGNSGPHSDSSLSSNDGSASGSSPQRASEQGSKKRSKRPSQGAPTPVPEPATMLLLGGGIAGLYGLKKKMQKKI